MLAFDRCPGVLGAIVGDVAGSTRESSHWKVADRDFPLFDDGARFTDDTVLTIAVADAMASDRDFSGAIRRWARLYPNAGYGGRFRGWLNDDAGEAYYSFGNGSAMRVSPVAYASDDLADLLPLARASASVTHDHPEGIKGAQAVASAILVARQDGDSDAVARAVQAFGYDLTWSVDRWREDTSFDVTCMGTVPAATRCVLEATDLESAIRNAIWIGGDADTLAAVAGSIAGALWGVPDDLARQAIDRLDTPLAEALATFEAWLAD